MISATCATKRFPCPWDGADDESGYTIGSTIQMIVSKKKVD
jgi:hypothetical protein